MVRLSWPHGWSRAGRGLAGGPFLLLLAACTSSPAPAGTSSAPAASLPLTASPSAPAGLSPVAGIFASALYGYDIALAADWDRAPATSRWPSAALEGRCPSDWDCFTNRSDDRTLAIAAVKIAADLPLDQWRTTIRQTQPDVCTDTGATSSSTLGGEPAKSWAVTCPTEGLKTIKTVAIHGAQGFVLIFASPSDDPLDADSSAFAALEATFRFAP
jgi:hypothetical protein